MSDLRELARSLRPYIEQAAQSLSDADGLKAKALYPPLADPIPAARSMEYTYGLYYSDPGDSKVYLCTRDTVNPVYHALSELVGLYVEEV